MLVKFSDTPGFSVANNSVQYDQILKNKMDSNPYTNTRQNLGSFDERKV